MKKSIKNFSTFAIEDGNVVNKTTGKIKNFKTGTKKYQLFDDNSKSHTLTFEQLLDLTESEKKPATPVKTKTIKPAQNSKVKEGQSKKEQVLELHKDGKTPAEIEQLTGIKANTAFIVIKIHRIMSLHAKGKTSKEIAEKTGYKVESVEWQIAKSNGRG